MTEREQGRKTPTRSTAFAHSSEEEFPRLPDFYQIDWLYEPRTFPLEWDTQGQVMEAFTPDFYLPGEGLYVELTTLRQDLVRGKNRKLCKLRELYPEVKIKLFYRRDYCRLRQKYGLLEKKGATAFPALRE